MSRPVGARNLRVSFPQTPHSGSPLGRKHSASHGAAMSRATFALYFRTAGVAPIASASRSPEPVSSGRKAISLRRPGVESRLDTQSMRPDFGLMRQPDQLLSVRLLLGIDTRLPKDKSCFAPQGVVCCFPASTPTTIFWRPNTCRRTCGPQPAYASHGSGCGANSAQRTVGCRKSARSSH